jgi:hemoglobin-like flavoprotein
VTPRQKSLVRRSLVQLRAEPDVMTARFYERLFALNPGTRRLFGKKDMNLQGTAFLQMLSMFVRGLDADDPAITEAIRASGRRHVGYGVVFSDYDTVGEALVWTVEDLLGPGATSEIRDAWAEAYRYLAATMRQASSNVL